MRLYNSPLRYPGGKQRLSPFIMEVIEENRLNNCHYVEPYAGGAGVAIELLIANKVEKIHLNDSCLQVFLFWYSILKWPEEFCRKISRISLTVEEWRKQKLIFSHPKEYSQFEVGFSLFYLNRCNRSGILTGGVIGGMNQNGKWKIDARFTRKELIKRIEAISQRKKSITLKNLDAEVFMTKYLPKLPSNTLVYCDPPYFHKADSLYYNHYKPLDHRRIAKFIQNQINKKWLVSYDSAPEILSYYKKRKSFEYDLQYNASKAYKGREVFIFSDKLKLPLRSSNPSINAALEELAS